MKSVGFHTVSVLATLGAAWAIFTYTVLPAGPPCDWDETAHAVRGLLIAYDLQQGDWLHFLFDTYRQVYWPPLHSWFTGIAYLAAGQSMVAARLVSVIAFIMTALLLYATGRDMGEKKENLAGLIALVLYVTSPPMASYAALSMLEIPGLLGLTLTFFIHNRVNRARVPPGRHMCLGLAMTFTYFIKSHYGVLLILTFLVTQLIDNRFTRRPLVSRANVYTLLPMVIIYAIWFAYPPKLVSTWNHLVNQPWGVEDAYSLEGLLYYPRAFFHLAGSPALLALFMGAIILAFKSWANRTIRFLLVLVIIQFLIGEIHHTKMERHLFPVMPPVFLLSGYSLAKWWRRPSQRGLFFYLPRLATCALLVSAVFLFPKSLHPLPQDARRDVINHVVKAARVPGKILILATKELRRPTIPMIDWQLVTEKKLILPPQAGTFTPSLTEIQKLKAIVIRLDAPWLKGITDRFMRRANHPGRIRMIYIGFYPFRFPDQTTLNRFLMKTLSEGSFDPVVILTSLEDGAPHPLSLLRPVLEGTGLKHGSARLFKDGQCRVDVFQQKQVMWDMDRTK